MLLDLITCDDGFYIYSAQSGSKRTYCDHMLLFRIVEELEVRGFQPFAHQSYI